MLYMSTHFSNFQLESCYVDSLMYHNPSQIDTRTRPIRKETKTAGERRECSVDLRFSLLCTAARFDDRPPSYRMLNPVHRTEPSPTSSLGESGGSSRSSQQVFGGISVALDIRLQPE